MNLLNNFLSENLINAIGWTLINSLWQGLIIGLVLAILLLVFSKSSPRVRELLAFGALAIIFTASTLTFEEYFEKNETTIDKSEYVTLPIHTESNSIKVNIPNNVTNESITIENYKQIFINFFRNNLSVITSIWFIGVLFFLFKLIGGYIYTQRLKNYKTFECDEYVIETVNELKSYLNINRNVKIYESAVAKVPIVIGYFKPVILFPLGLLSGLPQNQIEAILLHELAHIRRADYLINLFQSFAEVILFYHPVVWWISSIIREERENACDDISNEMSNNNVDLAKALLNINTFNSENKIAMASISNKNQLSRRVKRMVGLNKQNKSQRIGSSILLVIAFISFTAFACSSGYDTVDDFHEHRHSDYDYHKSGFSFNEDGDRYKVKFKGNNIYKLYINGDRIDEDEFYKYEDLVYDKRDELEDAMDDLEVELSDLDVNLSELKHDLKEMHVFRNKEFKRQARELRRNLKEKVRRNSHFNRKHLKREMRELKRNLRDLDDFNFNFNFDSEEFSASMEKLGDELSNISVQIDDIDIPEINIDFDDLKHDLDNMKIDINLDMRELKKELKKIKRFVKEFKSELVNDGILYDRDEDMDLEFENDSFYVNGDKIPNNLQDKYKEIYYDAFDEYPHEDTFFDFN